MPLPHRLAASLTLAAATLTACTSSGTSSPTSSSAPTAPATSSHAAGVGASHSLHGSDDSQQLTVRLDRILATARAPKDEKPARGKRYFAAELTITNTGTARLQEGPWISTTVTDSAGHQYDTATVTTLPAGAELPGEVKTAHGAARTGWIVFEVPKTAKITGLEYGATGGLGDTADWTF